VPITTPTLPHHTAVSQLAKTRHAEIEPICHLLRHTLSLDNTCIPRRPCFRLVSTCLLGRRAREDASAPRTRLRSQKPSAHSGDEQSQEQQQQQQQQQSHQLHQPLQQSSSHQKQQQQQQRHSSQRQHNADSQTDTGRATRSTRSETRSQGGLLDAGLVRRKELSFRSKKPKQAERVKGDGCTVYVCHG